MWELNSSIAEIILRACAIYFGLFFLFRFAGRKQLGKMSGFDLVLVLIISESVSNALGADENSIPGSLLSAGTLIGLNYLMDFLSFHSKRFEKWTEGSAQVMIRDGRLDRAVCKKELITECDVIEALRELQIEQIKDVRIAYLETNGHITAFEK